MQLASFLDCNLSTLPYKHLYIIIFFLHFLYAGHRAVVDDRCVKKVVIYHENSTWFSGEPGQTPKSVQVPHIDPKTYLVTNYSHSRMGYFTGMDMILRELRNLSVVSLALEREREMTRWFRWYSISI